jgi:hypothetical protein
LFPFLHYGIDVIVCVSYFHTLHVKTKILSFHTLNLETHRPE